MKTKFYAAYPIWLTLSYNPGTLLYTDVLWNIMRMILMSEGNEEYDSMDAESALEELDEMPMEEFEKLKKRAESEYAEPQFQDYLERIHLYLGTRNAPKLEPVESILNEVKDELTEEEVHNSLMELLDEMDWKGFQAWEVDNSAEMD